MSNNMDTLVEKTREFANATVKVAGEVVDASKQKLREMRLRSELKDAYARLGSVVYDARNKSAGQDHEDLLDIIIGEINEIHDELDKIAPEREEKGKKERYCAACGATNEESFAFCCKCGAKLD